MSLSKDLLLRVAKAIGDGDDFPRWTRDPEVNYYVDVLVSDVVKWEELEEAERRLYEADAACSAEQGE